jgi:hypothetical protein
MFSIKLIFCQFKFVLYLLKILIQKLLFIFIKITIKKAFNFLLLMMFSKLFNEIKQDNALKTMCYVLNL